MIPGRDLEGVDVGDYLRIIAKRKYTLINCVAFCVLVAIIYAFNATPIFQASVRILIERKTPKAVSIDEIMTVDTSRIDYYKTQYNLISSRSLARDVIKKLHLDETRELEPQKPFIDLSPFKNWIESTLTTLFQARDDSVSEGVESEIEADPYTPYIDRFLRKVEIFPIKNSRLVDVRFEGFSPALVTEVANTIAEIYILKNIELRSSVEKDTGIWLRKRVSELKKEVENSEKALQKFREKKNIVEFEEKRDIATQKLSDLSSEATKAKTERLRLKVLSQQLAKQKDDPIEMFHSMSDTLQNASIVQLHKDYALLEREYAENAKKFGPKHPQMIAISQKIKIIENQIPLEIDRLIRSVNLQLKSAKAKERSLLASLAEHKRSLINMDRNVVQYNSLKREDESNRKLYEVLVNRMKEVDVSTNYNESNIRIVDLAEIPLNRFKPQKLKIIGLALFLGTLGGILLIYLFESLDTTIRTIEDVEKHIPYPLLGAVSIFDKKEGELPVVNDVPSQRAEEFRIIRTNIMFTSPDNPKKVLMVTSAVPGEGKSTIVSNLAIVFARMGKNVLILDADLRRSRIHSIFGVKGQPGLTEVLFGQKDLKDVVQKTKINGVSVIPRGSVTRGLSPYSSEYLSSKKFKGLLNSLRESFDFVFVDVPPILNIADASVVAKYCDGILFALKSGFSDIKIINRAIKQLSASTPGKNVVSSLADKGEEKGLSLFPKNTTEVLGAIFNMVDYRKDGMGGYNKYYRGYYFDKKGKDISEKKVMSA